MSNNDMGLNKKQPFNPAKQTPPANKKTQRPQKQKPKPAR